MQQISARFERVVHKTLSLQYLLHVPPGDPPDGGWPIILALHGAGERGDDLSLVAKHGPAKVAERDPSLPFVVVSPQCPRNQWWAEEPLLALLDEMLATQPVDADRVYLTGLSMGGYATWSLGIHHPSRFAAAAPVCGGSIPAVAHRLKDVPLWVFHGARDPVVLLDESHRMVNAVRAHGGNVRFTIYPDRGHDAWTPTYDNPQLYEWFLQHRISDRQTDL
jgi:predicted peptidase